MTTSDEVTKWRNRAAVWERTAIRAGKEVERLREALGALRDRVEHHSHESLNWPEYKRADELVNRGGGER